MRGSYNGSVSKYVLFLKNQISLITTYRFDLFWRWISNAFEIIVYFSLWSLTTNGQQTDIKRLIIYYALFFGIFHNLQTSRVASWMGDDISSGQLNHYLTKPINFPLAVIIRSSTILIARVTVPVFLLVIGSFVFPDYLSPSSIANLLLFIIFTFLGLLLWNLLMVIIGCLAFWLTEIRSLVVVFDIILSFIKGAFIPVYLFSPATKQVLALTPFSYFAAFPTDIYQGLISNNQLLSGFFTIIIWTLLLFILSRFLYSRGVRRYEAYG